MLHFLKEMPPNQDFVLWRKNLPHLRGQGCLHLGPHEIEGHKVWDWRYDCDVGKLYNQNINNTVNLYRPSTSRGLSTRENDWGLVQEHQTYSIAGQLCSAE
jgi:hypothetical protein